jgi:hypothetical protein
MGAIISLIKGADKILLYVSGLAFFVSLIVLFGITYFITGTPFGTVIPPPNDVSLFTSAEMASKLIVLTTTWVFCPITMLISLILMGLFALIHMGLSQGKV